MRSSVPLVERRALLLALGTSLLSPAAKAQVTGSPAPTAEPIPDLDLTPNLFTRVAANVMINGQGPFSFVIDTGSATSAVSDLLAEGLNLPEQPPLLVHGIASATMTPSVIVERLSLRSVPARNLRCPVLPHEQLGADGLVGLDILGRFRLSFDTVRQQASLTHRGVRIISGGTENIGSHVIRDSVRSARGRFGQLIMSNLRVSGQPTAAFVDSGAQYSIGNEALSRAIDNKRSRSLGTSRSVPVLGVTGQSLDARLSRIDDLRLGSHRLGPTTLLFADLHCFETLGLSQRPALLIGADLLGRFRNIVLDFAANSVVFEGVRPPSAPLGALPG
ncbi:retroviral-like aspartic protease family protein [Brevundimonas sp.]|uniref:retroviral-like aspartic protease family protein n=1 Tax=Brevundimonas sp. TaxID=1871086 RepID=UPI0035B3ED5D